MILCAVAAPIVAGDEARSRAETGKWPMILSTAYGFDGDGRLREGALRYARLIIQRSNIAVYLASRSDRVTIWMRALVARRRRVSPSGFRSSRSIHACDNAPRKSSSRHA